MHFKCLIVFLFPFPHISGNVMQQIIANKYVVAIGAVRQTAWCSPCRTVARLIDLASDLLDYSLNLVLVCTGCPVSTLLTGMHPEQFLLSMCYPLTDWEKRNPNATFRPWGKPYSLLHASQHFWRNSLVSLHVPAAVYMPCLTEPLMPCLQESVLEHLFLPKCSFVLNLHLHCISLVQRHTQSEFLCH